MQKRKIDNIIFFEISSREKRELLKVAKVVNNNSLGEHYLELYDNKIIYEITDNKSFVFNDINDFEKYINVTSKPIIVKDYISTVTHPVNDDFFIENLNNYISIFNNLNKIDFSLERIFYFKKIDQILNTIDFNDFEKYRLSIIAVVGQCIIEYLNKEAHWDYIIYSTIREPVIVIENKTLIDPATIVYNEYNKKIKNNTYKVNTFRSIEKILNRYMC